MTHRYPSDRLRLPGPHNLTVGEARDFLDNYEALLPDDRKLLTVAQGLQHLLHKTVDINEEGNTRILDDEEARASRHAISEEFLRRPQLRFSEEIIE